MEKDSWTVAVLFTETFNGVFEGYSVCIRSVSRAESGNSVADLTFVLVEIEDVLSTGRYMRLVFRREDVSFQVGEVDGGMAMFGSA
jgi:hypothetical protein